MDIKTEVKAGTVADALAALKEFEGYAYVATPYTKLAEVPSANGFEYDDGLALAAYNSALYTGLLMRLGVVAFSPIVHGHFCATRAGLDKKDARLWIEQCAPLMVNASCLIVVTLPGWKESTGVQAEIDSFALARKPILFLSPDEIKGLVGNDE